MKERTDLELWLVWKDPVSRQRFVVGKLWFDEVYKFKYLTSKSPCAKHINNCGIDRAEIFGFKKLTPFPHLSVYRDEKLFHVFARRLPDASRPDYQRILKEYGLDTNCTSLELLEATGGRLATDTFEFATPFIYENSGEFSIEFFVAGWRYHKGEDILDKLSPGTKLELRLDPNNKFDHYAIKVIGPMETLIGYVPVYYTLYLDEAVKNNNYEASVVKVNQNSSSQEHLLVKVTGRAILLAHVSQQIKLKAARQKQLKVI